MLPPQKKLPSLADIATDRRKESSRLNTVSSTSAKDVKKTWIVVLININPGSFSRPRPADRSWPEVGVNVGLSVSEIVRCGLVNPTSGGVGGRKFLKLFNRLTSSEQRSIKTCCHTHRSCFNPPVFMETKL